MSFALPFEPAHRRSTGADATSESARFVESNRTRLLFSHAGTGSVVTILVGVAVLAIYWGVAPTPDLLSWAAAMGTVIGWRYALLRRYDREQPAEAELGAWRHRFIVAAAVGGLVFGMSVWLLAPHGGLERQLLLAFVVAGMGIGAIPLLGLVAPAYVAYVGSLFAPAVLWLLVQGTERHAIVGCLGVILFGALVATARNHGRVLERSLVLAHVNTDLADWLDHERATSRALRERERLLEEHQLRLRDFAEMGADLFWESDADLRFTYLSESYQSLTGVDPDTMLGSRVDAGQGPGFVPDTLCQAGAPDAEQAFREFHLPWTRPDGSTSILLSNGRPIRDASGAFLGLRGTVKDFTEQHRLAELLKHQANHDHLTGLVNRREFERRLQRLLDSARTTGSEHTVCYIDLDQFKVVNDTAGHAAGDELLQQVATALPQWTRARDTVARLGGDEFGLLLEHCGASLALNVAAKLRTGIERLRFQRDERSFRVSASIGIAPITATSESVAEVMANVDTACFAAKESGRNRVYVFEADDEDLVRRQAEMRWVTHITEGLEDDCFELAAQPIVALAPADSARAAPRGEWLEILVRLRGTDGSLILPGAFLPSAERYNLSTTLDRTVVEKTLAWLDRDRERLAGIEQCAVNLSGHSLMDSEFPAFLTERFACCGVPAEKFCFEITETVAISRLARATAFIQEVSALGCRFALDDFGTGLSSFAYLKDLPVNYIKIDGLFVRAAAHDPVSRAMVRSIHEIGQLMGKQTIAEYVESDELFAIMRAIGIDYAQGFAVGRPEPIGGPSPSGRDARLDVH